MDGAAFLAAAGARPAVVAAVLFHSGAREEARHHPKAARFYDGLEGPTGRIYELLTYCDLNTSPTGQRITVEQRLADIEQRYGPGHVVTLHIQRERPALQALAARVESDLNPP